MEGEDGGESAPSGAAAAAKGGRKEKSVLQAKLTKLAIKIGYIGLFVCFIIPRSYCDELEGHELQTRG